MMIQNTENRNIFKPNFRAVPAENIQLKNVVANINAKFQQKNQRFDIVAISSRARELEKSEKEDSEKTIIYENSPMSGKRTEAEWAESSLTQQRNGVNSIENALAYQKEKLKSTLSKISEYQKIADGSIPQSESLISKERASELVEKYKESIKTDFSKEIKNTISFYNQWAKNYDKYSGGLASKVMGNILESISAKSLGLDNLSDNPEEIMKALDDAMEKLGNISKSMESDFYKASGKAMTESLSPNTDLWKSRIELENTSIEMVTIEIDKNTISTGQTIKIDSALKQI